MNEDVSYHSLNRRQFLGRSAQNAAGMAAGVVGLSGTAHGRSRGRIRLGIIGLHNRGALLAKEFAVLPQAEVSALCDIDPSLLPGVAKDVEQLQSSPPRSLTDYRRILDDPRLDAVVVATPDHWHAAMATAALQAGKHVYLEVPVTHTFREGEELAAVEREGQAVLAVGLQQRSSDVFRSAVEFIRDGRLGTVKFARAWTVHRRKPATAAAAGQSSLIDIEQWRGPAGAESGGSGMPLSMPPHYHWRRHWDFGSGELGNWGVQMLDVARWGLNVGLPVRVSATGGSYVFPEEPQTPDTLSVQYAYDDCAILWEHRLWSTHAPEGRSNGVAFHGSAGTLVVDRGGWKVYDGREKASCSGSADVKPHLRNFLDAIRSGEPLAADLATGTVSSAMCHLGNISYRVGHEVRFDIARRTIPNAPAAAALLEG